MRWSLVVVALLATRNTSEANGLRGRGGVTVMYAPVMTPVWVVPAYVPCPTVLPPLAPSPRPQTYPYVPSVPPPPPPPPPTPEPPKAKTVEPPPVQTDSLKKSEVKKGPIIVESRSQSVVPAAASDKCKVGFWNLTGRQVQLTVAGQTHTVAKDKAITVELPRQFTWQIEERVPSQERVAADQSFHELVLRE